MIIILILLIIAGIVISIVVTPNTYEVREKVSDDGNGGRSWCINYIGAFSSLQARKINARKNKAPVFKNVTVRKI